MPRWMSFMIDKIKKFFQRWWSFDGLVGGTIVEPPNPAKLPPKPSAREVWLNEMMRNEPKVYRVQDMQNRSLFSEENTIKAREVSTEADETKGGGTDREEAET